MSGLRNPNRLRSERQARGWSQDELAERAGLHQPDVSGYERGVFPTVENIDRLASAFDVAPDEIFRWLREPAAGEAA